MTNDYTIDHLEKTFKQHAQKNVIQRQRDLESFKINYTDSEIPSDMLNDFCISEALCVICREIIQLKREIKYGKTFQRFKSGDV